MGAGVIALSARRASPIPDLQLGVGSFLVKAWFWARSLFGLAVLAVVALYGWRAWEAQWAKRHPEAARIARYEKIFDVAWKTVDERYYDPNFDHQRWRKVRDAYRPRIKTAPNDGVFYVNILVNMMHQVGTSHVSVTMPVPTITPVKSGPGATARPGKLAGCGGQFLTNDPGFDLAEVRRGHGAALVVSDVRRGSNAERAGVAPNDEVSNLKLSWRKGECPGAELRVRSEGQAPRDVAFSVDDRPPIRPMQRVDLPSGVRVLRFDRFDPASLDWLGANLPDAQAKGLVLDLRHNGGGKIWVERKIASLFLSRGVVIARSIRRGREHEEKTLKLDRRFDGPLVVLIGPASGSAAEVTAAALRYHRRARLVGGATAGSVLESQSYPLPGGGRVNVAVADVLTPDGRRLEGVGVKPDLPVVQTLDAIRAGRDLPPEAAERALLEGRWKP